MKSLRLIALTGFATAAAMTLSGCSLNTLIWGDDGARVIQATESFIDDVAAGEPSALVCEGADLDLGTARDWAGRSAGEPERFSSEYWDEQSLLDPQWNINVEGLPEGALPGDTFPGDLLYRETDAGLCVVDVVWSTLLDVG